MNKKSKLKIHDSLFQNYHGDDQPEKIDFNRQHMINRIQGREPNGRFDTFIDQSGVTRYKRDGKIVTENEPHQIPEFFVK